MIPLGNLFLRLERARFEVLSDSTWLSWESTIAERLGHDVRISPVRTGAALDIRMVPGLTLAQILQGALPLDEKLRALSLAAQALRGLHSVTVPGMSGESWNVSHGDATCHNVIVDLPHNASTWIDFDTRHLIHFDASERFADDLRTLLFSSAACLPEVHDEQAVRHVFGSYDDTGIVRTMQRRLSAQRCPSTAELAQAPLNFADYSALREMVLKFRVSSVENR